MKVERDERQDETGGRQIKGIKSNHAHIYADDEQNGSRSPQKCNCTRVAQLALGCQAREKDGEGPEGGERAGVMPGTGAEGRGRRGRVEEDRHLERERYAQVAVQSKFCVHATDAIRNVNSCFEGNTFLVTDSGFNCAAADAPAFGCLLCRDGGEGSIKISMVYFAHVHSLFRIA